ncbi:MAG: RusA family crossover junction endodeoxyribonuclease [Lachnospiraceae bacterium]|nr:RusA family crossover junction endodeoxyribonuclease [Lachnospiraceae bacterium]
MEVSLLKTVQFEIPGAVKGKGRPRVTKAGIAYTPKDTVQYENLVRLCYREKVGEYLEGQIRIEIDAYFPIPKSTSKYNRNQMILGFLRPTKKPDWDNIGKIICDSLNGVAYRDDAAVVSARFDKWYTNEEPKTIVTMVVIGEG